MGEESQSTDRAAIGYESFVNSTKHSGSGPTYYKEDMFYQMPRFKSQLCLPFQLTANADPGRQWVMAEAVGCLLSM